MSENRLEKILSHLIGQVESEFVKNPAHTKFSVDTRDIDCIDDAKMFMDHFTNLDFYMSIQRNPDGSFLIMGDKSFDVRRKLDNEEINRLVRNQINIGLQAEEQIGKSIGVQLKQFEALADVRGSGYGQRRDYVSPKDDKIR